MISCESPESETSDYKRTITSDEAIAIAKDRFEATIEYYNDDGFTKVYSPTYGSCDVYMEDDCWIVTLRGNYKGYKDKFASGKIHTQNFSRTFYINIYQ